MFVHTNNSRFFIIFSCCSESSLNLIGCKIDILWRHVRIIRPSTSDSNILEKHSHLYGTFCVDHGDKIGISAKYRKQINAQQLESMDTTFDYIIDIVIIIIILSTFITPHQRLLQSNVHQKPYYLILFKKSYILWIASISYWYIIIKSVAHLLKHRQFITLLHHLVHPII